MDEKLRIILIIIVSVSIFGLLVFVFVSSLYFLFYFCFFKLIKNIKINWLLTLAIFSPFSFYYPVMISKVTGRKEILYLAAISILSVLVSKIKFEHIKYILILILLKNLYRD